MTRLAKFLFAILISLILGLGYQIGRPISAPLSDKVHLEELTWVEVRDLVAQGKTIAIVPTGGTEQNGPHVVLGKHNYIVRFTAGKIAEELGNALVAPVISYVPEGRIEPPEGHMAFPGTISISEDLFEAVLESAARSLRAHGFKVICFVGSGSPTLWLDALHSSSSSRTEATLGDDRAAVSLSMNTGTKEHGRSVMVRVGYFPVELDDEKAIITATDFLPLGAEGTPEYGTPGLEAMTGSPGLRDLVSALSNKETIFALAEKELNPLQTVGEGEDATLQPTFGPLQGFVTDSDERFEMMFSGL